MTETTSRSRAVNDITAEDYDAITDAAHDLHNQVHDLMGRVGPAGHDPAWDELHELMQLVSVLSGAARRYADRARLPREPVEFQLPCGPSCRQWLPL